MAQVDFNDDNPAPAYTPPAQSLNQGFDADAWVKSLAGQYGIGAGETDVANLAGKNAEDRAQFQNDLTAQYQRRAASNGTPRAAGSGGGASSYARQFSDPSTTQLEDLASAQMGEIRGGSDLNSLLGFLRTQFSNLSTNPGYSTEDRALLNTQAFEPIEDRRKAAQQRSLERTAARGFLPSSGLNELDFQANDAEYDRQRTVAGRDLAIQEIGQRRADLDKAAQIGSLLGLDIPKSQRSEELNLSQLLYQLPRNALSDLMMVLNGSPSSSDLFGQSAQTQQSNLYAQQQADQRNAALMEQIGSLLGSLFGGR